MLGKDDSSLICVQISTKDYLIGGAPKLQQMDKKAQPKKKYIYIKNYNKIIITEIAKYLDVQYCICKVKTQSDENYIFGVFDMAFILLIPYVWRQINLNIAYLSTFFNQTVVYQARKNPVGKKVYLRCRKHNQHTRGVER